MASIVLRVSVVRIGRLLGDLVWTVSIRVGLFLVKSVLVVSCALATGWGSSDVSDAGINVV